MPSSVRAYAKVQVPGTYRATVTQPLAFRGYLLDQLRPLMEDFSVTVEVGFSQQNIPYPYVVDQGDELSGSGVTAAELARVFPSTDLSAATDLRPTACTAGVTAATCRWRCSTRRVPTSRSSASSTTAAATGAMCSRGSC